MMQICKETTDFLNSCDVLQARLADKRLSHDDWDLIEFGCLNLLMIMRPESRAGKA